MARISVNVEVCGKTKSNINSATTLTPLSAEIIGRLNGTTPYSPKEAFIKSMKENKDDIILYRDEVNDFVAYTKFGAVYCCLDGDYYVVFYPRPSLIPKQIILDLIEEENKCNAYDNVAEMYRFLSLTNEEKDKEGFAFYSWIWEDGTWDNKAKYYHFDAQSHYNQTLGAKLKKEQTKTTQNVDLGDLDALKALRKKMIEFV